MTGIHTQVICDELFTHPAVTTHPAPYTIIEMDVTDTKTGPHRHIDLVYVLQALPGGIPLTCPCSGTSHLIAENHATPPGDVPTASARLDHKSP